MLETVLIVAPPGTQVESNQFAEVVDIVEHHRPRVLCMPSS